jgi:hypothetical protein
MQPKHERTGKQQQRPKTPSTPPPLEPKQGVYGSGGSYGIGGGFEESGSTMEEPQQGLPVVHKGPVPTND